MRRWLVLAVGTVAVNAILVVSLLLMVFGMQSRIEVLEDRFGDVEAKLGDVVERDVDLQLSLSQLGTGTWETIRGLVDRVASLESDFENLKGLTWRTSESAGLRLKNVEIQTMRLASTSEECESSLALVGYVPQTIGGEETAGSNARRTAYCLGGIYWYVAKTSPGFVIQTPGWEVTSIGYGVWSSRGWGEDFVVSLVQNEQIITSIDLTSYLHRGDLVEISYSESIPTNAFFWGQGLGIVIRHLDGSYEPPISG